MARRPGAGAALSSAELGGGVPRGIDVWRVDLPPHLGRIFASLVAGDPLAETLAKGSSDLLGTAELADPSVAISEAFSQWMRAGCFAGVARARRG